jgi:predicted PurR-regulated permease PerM
MAPSKHRGSSGARRGATRGDLQWDSLFQSLGRMEIVLLVGAVLLLLVLIYTIQTILSPFLVLGAIIYLVYPMRGYRLARSVMWLSIILFAIWFVSSISGILAPFVVSLVFAYILNPVVDVFEGWKVPRWVSSLVIILLLVGGIALILFLVLPIAVSQFQGVLDTVSKLIGDFRNWVWNSKTMHAFERYGISAEELQSTLANSLTPRLEDILKGILQGSLSVVSSVSKLVTQIFYVFLVPFLTFYILTDFKTIGHRFRMLFPRKIRGRVSDYMERADDMIGHYLRGALTVAILQGIIISVIFSIMDIKYALLLGLLAAILDLVPYFGLLTILALSCVVATFSEPPVIPKVIFAIGSIGFLHLAEVVFLSPRFVGGRVGLHPLLIILSLLVFAYFMGFVGLIVAVPASALILLFVREWEEHRHDTYNPQSSQSAI